MKKQVITVLITLLVVAVLEAGVFFVCKAFDSNGNKEETKTEESKNEGTNNDDKLIGTYAVTYTDKGKFLADYLPSTLSIYEDGTYAFNYNNCNHFFLIKGQYEIKNDNLTLLGSKEYRPELIDENLSFVIVSSDELYIARKDFSCTIGSEAYQNGYGSFKKVY